MIKNCRICLVLIFFLIPGIESKAHGQNDYYSVTTDKSLQEVLDDIEFAITERNLRITNRLHIGKTIRERGNSEFPDYEIILYCSLTFAEKILELNPDYINYCPGRITVRKNNNHVIITAPLWPDDINNVELRQLILQMNSQVRDIVDFATKDWIYEK